MTGSIVEWTEDLPEIQVNSLYKFDLDTGGNKMACFLAPAAEAVVTTVLQKKLDQKEKEAEKPQEEKTARVRLNDKRKMSFKEKREFEQLEKEIAELEAEKAQIEELLCSGMLSVDELTEKSKRLPEVNDLIDEKTMRWLELSEIEG